MNCSRTKIIGTLYARSGGGRDFIHLIAVNWLGERCPQRSDQPLLVVLVLEPLSAFFGRRPTWASGHVEASGHRLDRLTEGPFASRRRAWLCRHSLVLRAEPASPLPFVATERLRHPIKSGLDQCPESLWDGGGARPRGDITRIDDHRARGYPASIFGRKKTSAFSGNG